MTADPSPPPGPDDGQKLPVPERESRSERRSVRRRAGRRKRASHLFWAVGPALACFVVVAVLFPLIASPGRDNAAEPSAPPLGSAATTGTASATTGATSATTEAGAGGTTVVDSGQAAGDETSSVEATPVGGTAVLVVRQDAVPVVFVLVCAGPASGMVLGMPAPTLLRSGDGFDRLAAVYAADGSTGLRSMLADALGTAVGSVASVVWGDLRSGLQTEGIGALPADRLDAGQVAAAEIAAALAAVLQQGGAAGGVWQTLPLSGDVEAFRAIVIDGQGKGTAGRVWTGRAIAGRLVESGSGTYLEPDIDPARELLATTEAGG
jgi:hypothetical protein